MVSFLFLLKLALRGLLAALFLFMGYLHFAKQNVFESVMPPFIPFPTFCVLASGVCEILGGMGLLVPIPEVTFIAKWGLVLLLVAVFPVNIYMALHPEISPFRNVPDWVYRLRLPFQPLLIVAVLWCTSK
jgi:uncharacterized membrane protein